MTNLAFWTWLSAGVLIVVPPVIFVLFVRDARQVFQDLGRERPEDAANAAGREAA